MQFQHRTLSIKRQKALANAYIEELGIQLMIRIPSDIAELCCQYYIPSVQLFIESIDEKCVEVHGTTDKSYQILKSTGGNAFYVEQAISSTDEMIYTWNLKCLNVGVEDMIAFVEKIDKIKESTCVYNDTLFGSAIIWWNNIQTIFINNYGQDMDTFRRNDQITIIFDTVNWTVEFLKNEISLTKIELDDRNKSYYLVIVVGSLGMYKNDLIK
eukprot:428090_1